MGGWITAPQFRRHRTWLRWFTGVLLVLGLGGAWLGLASIQPASSTGDLFLDELQLLIGNWQQPEGTTLGWWLEVARIILPLAAAGFGVLLLADIVSFVRSQARGHAIVVGTGAAAQALASRVRRGTGGNRRLALVAELGDKDTLMLNGIRRANAIVVCGDESFDTATNLATAGTAMQLARRTAFTAHVLVSDAALALALRARRLVQPDDEARPIRVFTVDELAARHHVRGVPLQGQANPHILVVGSSPFGRAVIVEFARHWSVAGDPAGKPLVTLVARDAKRALQEICDRWPFVERSCDLRANEQPVEQAMLEIAERPYRSYFCDEHEERAQGTALTAATRWSPNPGSIVVRLARLAQSDATANLFDNLGGALDPVAVYDAAASEILVGDDPLLAFAREIHEAYLEDAARRGETLGHRNLVPWGQLSEDVRQSNLEQAIAFPRTLRAIRCTVAPRSRLADPFFFRPGEVEKLARAEHEHWVAERTAKGWKYGKERSDRRRVHPDLKPWAELTDAARSRNRDIVKERPLDFDRVLEREGLQIVRLAADPAQVPPPAVTAGWLTSQVVELLAQSIHERYLSERIADGEVLGSREALQPWAALTEDLKESNRAQVRDLAAKLDLLEAAVTTVPPAKSFEFAPKEVEMLARYEHDRWVSQRIGAGWTYGQPRDDSRKVHNLLVPWLYLTHRKHEVDRQMVRAIPDQLKVAGLYLVRR